MPIVPILTPTSLTTRPNKQDTHQPLNLGFRFVAAGIEQQLLDGQRKELGRTYTHSESTAESFIHPRTPSLSGFRFSELLQHGSIHEPVLDEQRFGESDVR